MSFLGKLQYRVVADSGSWLDRLSSYGWKVTSVPEFYDEKHKKEWLNAVVTLKYEDKRISVSKKQGRYTTVHPFGVVEPSKLTFANGTLTIPTEYNGIKSTMSFKML